MNDEQQNQIDSAQVTCDYVQQIADVPIWSGLGAFADDVTALEGGLNILDALAQIQDGKTTGITANKERMRQSLSTRLVRMAKACVSFGNATGNDDLVAQGNALNSASEVEAIKDGQVAARAQALYSRAITARDAGTAAAAHSGLTSGAGDKLFTPLQSAITAYSGVSTGPQGAINARANATTAIANEITRILGILKDMDNLSAQFEEDNPDFVAGYHRARQIINRGSGGGGSTPPTAGPASGPTPPK